MLNDAILIWKFNRGSADALRSIYEKYRSTMLTIATALCNDIHTAEDVVQDCFISFARRSGQLRLKGSLKSYLVTSVVNRLRDRRRKSKYHICHMNPADLVRCADQHLSNTATCSEQMIQLNEALAHIDPDQREVVVLYTRGQMTYKEIANLQNVSIPTVQRRYHSGLDKLRILLNGELEK